AMRWLAILALMMPTGPLVSAESRSAEPDTNAAVDLGPIESAPQLLGTLGVGPAVLGKFQPDTPLDDADVEPLLRTLAALAQFPLEKSHRWAIDDLDAAQIAERGESLRGEL